MCASCLYRRHKGVHRESATAPTKRNIISTWHFYPIHRCPGKRPRSKAQQVTLFLAANAALTEIFFLVGAVLVWHVIGEGWGCKHECWTGAKRSSTGFDHRGSFGNRQVGSDALANCSRKGDKSLVVTPKGARSVNHLVVLHQRNIVEQFQKGSCESQF